MFILIAGGGIVGRTITKSLARKHDVVVIEQNYELCEGIASKLGAVAIQGDATNINTLKDAGIEKCDYALGVMGSDTSNLLFSLLCKNFGIKNIFVRMRDPEYREAFELAGASNIAHSVAMVANKFVLDIENPDIRRVASFSNGKAEISIIKVQAGSKADGQTVSDLVGLKDFPSAIVIAGIFDDKKDELIIPRGNIKIYSETQVFLVGSNEEIRIAYKFFTTKKNV